MNTISIADQSFLIGDKCIFWEKERALLLADLHLGKIEHFRKEGIAIPQKAAIKDWEKLQNSIDQFNPTKVIFLGDLFHSKKNSSFEQFELFVNLNKKIHFVLVVGNHDNYTSSKLSIECVDELSIFPFFFTHHPTEIENAYNICGHVHPAVTLKGKGLQKMVLPCLWVQKKCAILPAFGSFTGNFIVKPSKEDELILFEN